MRNVLRAQRWRIVWMLAGLLVVYPVVFALPSHGWSLTLLPVGVAWCGWLLWLLRYADRWRGFRAPAGVRFRRSVDEFPLVTDHRDVFGPGAVRNLVEGPGYTAFQVVDHGARHWFYAVPLSGAHPRWRAKPPRYNNGNWPGKSLTFGDRYIAEGRVPRAVQQLLADARRPLVDLACTGDLLVARELGLSGRAFPAWSASEGAVVRDVAAALEPTGEEAEQRAISAPDPSRNVWQAARPTATAPGDAAPRWNQPPRA